MSKDRRKVEAIYGGKLRLRVCGLLRRADGALLCALHEGVGPSGRLWVPPGGGLEFGESIADAIRREFAEETGLGVEVGALHSVHEYIAPPLHAVELFYHVVSEGEPMPQLGTDPEWPASDSPLLSGLEWVTAQDVVCTPTLFHEVVKQVLGER